MRKLLSVFLIGVGFLLSGCKQEEVNGNRVYVFSQPGCGHCVNAHEYMSRYYKNYDIKELNIREGSNMNYMVRYARKFKVAEQSLGTPFIVIGDTYIMGWGNEQVREFNRLMKNIKPSTSKK